MSATIHLICGFMGFGKTTFAKQLEQKNTAIRLTHDEFMVKLYERNLPEPNFRLNYKKVDDMLWDLAEKIIHAGTDVIMDYGFWTKEARKTAQQKAKAITPNVVWYQLQCDIDTAKSRVLKRTKNNQEELFIDEACFGKLFKQYEPITPDEGLQVVFHSGT